MDELYPTERVRPGSSIGALKSGVGVGALMLLFLSLLSLFTIYMLAPPGAVTAAAPPSDFSSGRAMKHLEVISSKPHPVGSLEHAGVRDYILRELSGSGLPPEVQETSVLTGKWGGLRAATVRNVVAKMGGTGGGGKALLVVAHYDTVPTAPGASDDGASVATMLETVRALKAAAPLSNDVIFLFTDGEELGLLGAQAFVEEHPWAKDVGLVLNFEARGAGGPALMFETSSGNRWLIEEFAKAAPYPAANSLSYEIYKLLPNNTDLTVFKGANLPGMNFAYIDGAMRYHTRADSIENIDERSLQHQGTYALSLTRHFGNLQLDRPRAGNAVYFDVFGRTLLHYPSSWVVPLTVLACALFAAVLALGFRRKRLTFRGLAAGFFLFVLDVLAAAGIVTLIWWLVSTLQLRAGRSLLDDLYQSKLYFAGFTLVAVAVTAALYNLYRRRVSTENLTAGALLCWLFLLAVTSVLMPGGSYLLMWPLLFGLAALAFLLVSGPEGRNPVTHFAVLSLCAVPGIVLLVPMIYQVSVAMGLGLVWAVVVMVVLLCGLLVPHFALAGAGARWWLPGAVTLVAAVLLAAAAFNSGFDRRSPKSNHLFYVLNADTGKAVWASADAARDEWTAQFFPPDTGRGTLSDYLPLNPYNFLKTPAPVVALQPADLRVVSDTTQGDVRTLLMRVTSPHQAVNIAVPRDANVEVVGAVVNGKRVEAGKADRPPQSSAWELQYWAPPGEGFDLTLELKGSRPVVLKILDQSYGLPVPHGTDYKPRPDYIIPSSLQHSDQSLVSKSYAF